MSFSITILGSSGALPAYNRFPSSQFLTIQNRHFLIDCGEGSQMQLMRFNLPYHKINHIFISHLHGDHYLGLMGLLFSLQLQRRTNDLHLYSHRGLDEIITLQLKHARSALNFNLIFHEIDSSPSQIIFEDDVLSVETIPLRHKIPCVGFLIKEKSKPRKINKEKLPKNISLQQIASLKLGHEIRDENGNVLFTNKQLTLPPKKSWSYAYCSDTAPDQSILSIIKKVDVLYHESTFMESEKEKALETLHSTARQAAAQAKAASVGKLLIGHFSARYRDLEPLLVEAQSVFQNTSLAIEGETIDLDE
ncbi:MAG: ribonuclease Z [Flammeovirgaceae bacterium]|nr:ribonuclease Z [Flammeovirgaceae bacterium]